MRDQLEKILGEVDGWKDDLTIRIRFTKQFEPLINAMYVSSIFHCQVNFIPTKITQVLEYPQKGCDRTISTDLQDV